MVRALAVLLCVAACTPQPRVFAEPAPAADGIKGKRVAVRVSHEGRVKNGSVKEFDPAMLTALREQLESAGLEVRRDSSSSECVIDVNVLFDSPVEMTGDRAIFRFYVAKAGRATVIHSFEETSIATADLTTALPRAAAIRLRNEVVAGSDTSDVIRRFANAALNTTEKVTPGVKSVLTLPLKAGAEVSPTMLTIAANELNAKLAARNVFRVINVSDLPAGSTASRDIEACTSVSCTAQIGTSLGVNYVSYGTLGLVGQQYQVVYTTVESATAHVVSRVTRAIANDESKFVAAVDALAVDVTTQWASSANVGVSGQ